MTIKVLSAFGTRPEAIKMAPLLKELHEDNRFISKVIVTGQHREMLDQVLEIFDIHSDYDLDIMKQGQTLTDISSLILEQLEPILKIEQPNIVLVHGDTTTTLAVSLSAFYQKIPIGHVEAGLRSGDKYSPFPEEMNRQLTDSLSDLYFAPTIKNKRNLLKENRPNNKIYVTGNTAIDTLKYTIVEDFALDFKITQGKERVILVTMHRRENIGKPMEQVFCAIRRLAYEEKDIQFIFPIHKNPIIRSIANKYLLNIDNVSLIEPLDVVEFHNYANKSYLVLTDSGGIQEEVPHLGVPVLVLRKETERTEGIEAGTIRLIGTDQENVYKEVKKILYDEKLYSDMVKAVNPYGDGSASKMILESIVTFLKE